MSNPIRMMDILYDLGFSDDEVDQIEEFVDRRVGDMRQFIHDAIESEVWR